MEMYTSRKKNAMGLAYHYISHTVDSIRVRVHSIINTGISGGHRVKSGPERQAESVKRYYEAQAMAATWQGPRYFR
jgi:hypothetical protein